MNDSAIIALSQNDRVRVNVTNQYVYAYTSGYEYQCPTFSGSKL